MGGEEGGEIGKVKKRKEERRVSKNNGQGKKTGKRKLEERGKKKE